METNHMPTLSPWWQTILAEKPPVVDPRVVGRPHLGGMASELLAIFRCEDGAPPNLRRDIVAPGWGITI